MSDGHGSRTHLPLHTTLIQVSEETGRKGREREGGEMGERGRGGGAWKGGGETGDQRWGSLAGETLLDCLQEKVTSQEISWPGEFDLVYLLL